LFLFLGYRGLWGLLPSSPWWWWHPPINLHILVASQATWSPRATVIPKFLSLVDVQSLELCWIVNKETKPCRRLHFHHISFFGTFRRFRCLEYCSTTKSLVCYHLPSYLSACSVSLALYTLSSLSPISITTRWNIRTKFQLLSTDTFSLHLQYTQRIFICRYF